MRTFLLPPSALPVRPGHGGSRPAAEPVERPRICRRASYGPLVILYDCHESLADGECDRDVLKVTLEMPPHGAAWDKPARVRQAARHRCRQRQHQADALAQAALAALQKALRLTLDELIENAPVHEDVDTGVEVAVTVARERRKGGGNRAAPAVA